MAVRRVRRTLEMANIGLGIGGVALVLASLLVPSGASAASGADGSDWGSQGTLSSDSAVTVRWDNTGNGDLSTVYRDQRQKVAHTTKTYNDIPASERAAVKAAFGGMSVSVSQTRNLVNQSVTVTATGAEGGDSNGYGGGTYLQIFQCWGTADQSEPDPLNCEVGADGPDATVSGGPNSRGAAGDALTTGGEWAEYGKDYTKSVPFVAITGESAGAAGQGNGFFNKITTNELSHAAFDGTGSVSRPFEVQTGAESSGLGCGYRSDAASTDVCWIVVVPRLAAENVYSNYKGPISPSNWARRLQIPLTMQDVFSTCAGGRDAVEINGSEALRTAVGSWLPGICEEEKLTLGYSVNGDEVARNRYAAGTSTAILTTQPANASTQTAYIPVSVTAPVIAYTIDYLPGCKAGALSDVVAKSGDEGEAAAKTCGYGSLAEAKADYAKTGEPVTDLRLNARLVAKLLTQTYDVFNGAEWGGVDTVFDGARTKYGSAPTALDTLFTDAEFQALNPQLDHMDGVKGGSIPNARNATRALVEGTRSDEAAALWEWILQDPGARSFLNGCPDPNGYTINPFYSTRTYAGCEYQKTKLDKEAARERAAVDTPDGFVDEALSYPPDGSPYPQPQYYAAPPSGTVTRALTFTDAFPAYTYAQNVGYQTAWMSMPTVEWCLTLYDLTCLPAPGKWKASSARASAGQRVVLGVTDAGSAAKNQTATALLCASDDEAGDACVGADTTSLQKGAEKLVADEASGTVQLPTDVSSFYAAGAYPMTLPVYAAVNLEKTTATQRAEYASVLSYITTTGQTPGFASGDLAPGYAPLTSNLLAVAKTGLAELANGPSASATAPPTSSATARPSASPSTTPTPSPTPSATTPAGGTPSATTPSQAAVPAQSTGSQSPSTLAALGTSAVGKAAPENAWPAWALPLGAALACLSGVFAPILRRRNTITIGKWRLP